VKGAAGSHDVHENAAAGEFRIAGMISCGNDLVSEAAADDALHEQT
jgi:hypothetical protein